MPPTTQYGLLQELSQRFGTAVKTAEFSRPANTTPYAVGDVVSNSATTTTLLSFSLARENGGSGYITKARLMTNQAANAAEFRLHLFTVPSASLASPIAVDNAPYAMAWANRTFRIGAITFPLLATDTGSDCAEAVALDVQLAFDTIDTGKEIYGVLQTRTAFTPNSGQSFFVELGAEYN